MIVSYAPGGGSDVIARLAGAVHGQVPGQQREHRRGEPAGRGRRHRLRRALARARPDGYTIGFVNTPNVLTIPIERKSNFHWQDYDLLGNVVDDPDNISVRADSEFKTPEGPGGLCEGATLARCRTAPRASARTTISRR
jgi:tripartite-type tricarboxylate transporter receptor subunit TctC